VTPGGVGFGRLVSVGVVDGAGAVVPAGSGSASEVGVVREGAGATAPVPCGESGGETPGDVVTGVGDGVAVEGVASVPAPAGEAGADLLLGVAAGPEGSSSTPARSANVPASTRQVPAAASSTQLRRAPGTAATDWRGAEWRGAWPRVMTPPR